MLHGIAIQPQQLHFAEFASGAFVCRIEINLGYPMLHVKDDGKGMDPEALSRMMDFGHKRNAHDKHKLGKYGVGFKTGAMRIGKDAIVFTRKGSTASIGLLSQVGSQCEKMSSLRSQVSQQLKDVPTSHLAASLFEFQVE